MGQGSNPLPLSENLIPNTMKRKSIISLFACLLGFGITTTSCEDMLTPDMDRYNGGFSGKDTVAFYYGILSNLQEVAEQNFLLGEIRGELVDTTMYSSDSIASIANFERLPNGENNLLNRAAYYKVINQCNYYLQACNTGASKNSVYYMRKECAQVELIRAWTYMQLVQNYGEVPFITQPVDNADTGWETNSPEGSVNASNLLDKLYSHMQTALAYQKEGRPQYGDLQTGGGVAIPNDLLLLPGKVVMADLYLLRGRDRNDYIQAAKYYNEYLNEVSKRVSWLSSAEAIEVNSGTQTNYYVSVYDWLNDQFKDGGQAQPKTCEAITVVPSASNIQFGKVLAQMPQFYGFDVTTSASTDGTTSNDAGTVTGSVSGSITTIPNYKNRQLGPSSSYLNLCAAQNYTSPVFSGSDEVVDVKYYKGVGDARLAASAPLVTTKEGRLRFIDKFCPANSVSSTGEAVSFAFRYMKSIYRLSQVMLRYAEAVNRAGFPRYAFAILRNGLSSSNMPEYQNSASSYTGVLDSVCYDNVNKKFRTIYYLDSISGNYRALNYISAYEVQKAHSEGLNTTMLYCNGWNNDGLHELGCGRSSHLDSLYSYRLTVSKRILEEAQRTNTVDAHVLKVVADLENEGKERLYEVYNGVEPTEAELADYTEEEAIFPDAPVTDPLEINAVEKLIADEMALETAFEGTRFFDLMRIASHMNNDPASPSGTEWLAWLVSRRSLNLMPYENVTQKGTLYPTLLSPANWYLRSPEY